MAFQRITGATPSTPLVTASGTIADINDDNPVTTCEVEGILDTHFWFVMDLGSSKPVDEVRLIQWYETGAADSGFSIAYSDSTLGSGNHGTDYGATFSATQSPTKQDTTRTPGRVTARYWGLLRVGNFDPNNVGVADFNLYQDVGGGGSRNLLGVGI